MIGSLSYLSAVFLSAILPIDKISHKHTLRSLDNVKDREAVYVL